MLYGMDICAGSGIGSAAFEALGFCQTVCYVERDAYCQRLIEQRMQDGWLAPAPIWDDLRTFDGRPWRGIVDFVFGGIPCQPHSLAGKRGGAADERDLWPDFWRVVCEVGPRLVLVENVPGLLSSDGGRAMGRILGDLASGGYDAEWDCIPAQAVGAPHRRDRVWVVAYAGGTGRQQESRGPHGNESTDEGRATADLHQPAGDGKGLCAGPVADADRSRRACVGHDAGGDREGRRPGSDCPLGSESTLADASRERTYVMAGRAKTPTKRNGNTVGDSCEAVADAEVQPVWPGLREGEPAGQWGRRPCDGGGEGPAGWWELEPDVDRVADGVAARVDRLRTIGNGWVPQVAAVIAARIGGF